MVKNKVVYICCPPANIYLPSPAFSALKGHNNLQDGIETNVIYANVILSSLEKDFFFGDKALLSTPEFVELVYALYTVWKRDDQSLIKRIIILFKSLKPDYFLYVKEDELRGHLIRIAIRIEEKIERILSSLDFDSVLYIGFTAKLYQWKVGVMIAEHIKARHKDIPIVIGGMSSKQQAEAFLSNFECFDFATWGEGEITMSIFHEMLLKESGNADGLRNFAYRANNTIVSCPEIDKYVDLCSEELMPDFDDYFSAISLMDIKPTLTIEGSRGCSWNRCSFCYLNTGYRTRYKSAGKILSELRYLISRYDVYSFEFLDNAFFNNDAERTNLLLDGLKSIKKEYPAFRIVFIEMISKNVPGSIYKDLREAGVSFVQFGYESTSDNLLKKINKNNSFASNLNGIRHCLMNGIGVVGANVIHGLPEETMEDSFEAVDNIRFLRFFFSQGFDHRYTKLSVNSDSRYYKKDTTFINNKQPIESFLSTLYADRIPERYHPFFFEYLCEPRSPYYRYHSVQSCFYKQSGYNYIVRHENHSMMIVERIKQRVLSQMEVQTSSIEYHILFLLQEEVLSIDTLLKAINVITPCKKEELIEKIDSFQEKGWIYHSPDYKEITTIVTL